jgi:hypothetical protein
VPHKVPDYPAAHEQLKVPIPSRHAPPLRHGIEAQANICVWQNEPLYGDGQAHVNELMPLVQLPPF